MGIRVYRPTSPGRRNASVNDFAELTPGAKPEKSLLKRAKKKGGRNNQGFITARHRGGGHKRMYRIIDFRRTKDGIVGKIDSIQYDPNRTARIALVVYSDGEKAYVLAPEGLKAGQTIENGDNAAPVVGNCLPMRNIPPGTEICCVEMTPGRGAALCRSAGMSAVLMARESGWAQLQLPSGEVRRVPGQCRAVIGRIGNSEHEKVVIGKAGRNRWKGRRPYVRGTAMNPHDHPHGGGEGRTKGGRHPVSPTGVPAKGGSTRRPRKPGNSAIIRRRKSVRYGQLKLK